MQSSSVKDLSLVTKRAKRVEIPDGVHVVYGVYMEWFRRELAHGDDIWLRFRSRELGHGINLEMIHRF